MKLKSKWIYHYQSGQKGQSVSHDYHIEGDNLYFALSIGLSIPFQSYIFKLNLQTQEAEIIFDHKHIIQTVGLVDHEKMLLTSFKGMAFCLDFNGNTIWETKIGHGNASSKIALDNNSFYASNDSVYCLNKENGEIRWVNETFNKKCNCNILLDEQFLYSAESGGKIFCLDKFSGKTIWTYGEEEWIPNVEKIGEDKLLVNHSHGWFYILDAKTGNLITKITANGRIYNRPVIEGNRLYIGDANASMHATSGNMTCYKILPNSELKEIYKVNVNGGGISSPACIHNDMVFFGTDGGYLYCIDKTTGNELMARKKCKGACRNIIIRESEVILLTDKGQIECFDLSS